jgi:formylmethanofuran dehydrogenase subunit E
MPKSNLIICPTCRQGGTKSILGEMNNGTFSVMRFHKAFTMITGADFTIHCSYCGEPVYERKEKNEPDSNIRQLRVSRLSFVGTIA